MTEKDILIEMMKRGNAEAAYTLGKTAAENGDNEAAERYYRFGVRNGHLRSMNNLGTLYFTRGTTPAEKMKGLNLWFVAASKGCAQAMANLGLAYFNDGRYDEAFGYWSKAAEQELPEAFHGLGRIAMRQNDLDAAEKYLRKAADMGCAAAWNDLGLLMRKRRRSEEAMKCFHTAAEKGDKTAAENIVSIEKKGE